MVTKNCCVVIYTSPVELEAAVGKLKIAGCDLGQTSVIARENKTDGHQTGFRNALKKLLSDTDLIYIGEIGTLLLAGQMITMLSQPLDAIDIGDRTNPLAATFFRMGIPRTSIKEYEQAIIAGKLLLIFYALRKDVEQVCDVLHSEAQQVIVHHT